jgi:predicted DNA-binding transcriptional regulator AlpA
MIVISDHFSETHKLPLIFPLQDSAEAIKLAGQPNERLLSPNEAATMLGMSEKNLANWRLGGTEGPKHVRIGSRIAYRRTDVVEFIAACVRQSTSEVRSSPLSTRR